MTRKTAAKWLEMDPIHYDMIGDNVAEAYIYDSDFEYDPSGDSFI